MRSDPAASFVRNGEYGFARVRNDPKAAMFTSEVVIYGTRGLKLNRLTEGFYVHYGFAFQKGSEFRTMFDHHINKMVEAGVWQIIEKVRTMTRTYN